MSLAGSPFRDPGGVYIGTMSAELTGKKIKLLADLVGQVLKDNNPHHSGRLSSEMYSTIYDLVTVDSCAQPIHVNAPAVQHPLRWNPVVGAMHRPEPPMKEKTDEECEKDALKHIDMRSARLDPEKIGLLRDFAKEVNTPTLQAHSMGTWGLHAEFDGPPPVSRDAVVQSLVKDATRPEMTLNESMENYYATRSMGTSIDDTYDQPRRDPRIVEFERRAGAPARPPKATLERINDAVVNLWNIPDEFKDQTAGDIDDIVSKFMQETLSAETSNNPTDWRNDDLSFVQTAGSSGRPTDTARDAVLAVTDKMALLAQMLRANPDKSYVQVGDMMIQECAADMVSCAVDHDACDAIGAAITDYTPMVDTRPPHIDHPPPEKDLSLEIAIMNHAFEKAGMPGSSTESCEDVGCYDDLSEDLSLEESVEDEPGLRPIIPLGRLATAGENMFGMY